MGWSGGTYTKGNAGSGGWTGDAGLGIGIEASRHDTQDNDFAAGINNALAKDGQNAPTANLPMGGYKHTGVGDASAGDQYLSYGQLLDVTKAVTTSGTSPAYEVTLTPAPAAYFTGMIVDIVCHSNLNVNTGATVNVNGLGAKDIKIADGTGSTRNPAIYEMTVRQPYRLVYVEADGFFRLLNPTYNLYPTNTFTPTIGSSAGSATIITPACSYGYLGGKTVLVTFDVNFSLSSATAQYISFTLPVDAASNFINAPLQGGYVSGISGYSEYTVIAYFPDASTVRILRNDYTNFPIDASMFVRINGIYTAA